jgi:hypothetical protein
VLYLLAERTRVRSDSPSGLAPTAQYIPAIPAALPPGATPTPHDDLHRASMLRSLLAELRLIPRMYFDPRYRLSRLAQVGVPVVFVMLVVNYLFFNYSLGFIPAVPQIVERVLIILLGIVLYQILAREAARYKAVLEYLDRSS